VFIIYATTNRNQGEIMGNSPVKLLDKVRQCIRLKGYSIKLLAVMHGTHQLMAKLIYGCGLRVMECIRLRVKDIDFAMKQIAIRDVKP